MRKLLSLILSLICLTASADQAIRLEFFNGQTLDIFLDESTILSFAGDTLECKTLTNDTEYEIGSIQRIFFVDVEPTAVYNHLDHRIIVNGRDILVNVWDATISLCSISGEYLSITRSDNFGDASVTIPDNCKGVFILTVEAPTWSQSIKIIKQ